MGSIRDDVKQVVRSWRGGDCRTEDELIPVTALVRAIQATAAIEADSALDHLHDGGALTLVGLGQRLENKADQMRDAQLEALDELDAIDDALSPQQRRIKGLLVCHFSYRQIAKATQTKLKHVIRADVQARFIADRVLDNNAAANRDG